MLSTEVMMEEVEEIPSHMVNVHQCFSLVQLHFTTLSMLERKHIQQMIRVFHNMVSDKYYNSFLK